MCVTQRLENSTSANVTNQVLTIALENHVCRINGNLMAVTPNQMCTYVVSCLIRLYVGGNKITTTHRPGTPPPHRRESDVMKNRFFFLSSTAYT